MIDWTHIPIHIRCTERNKIDPRYPLDDARWWRLTEQKAERTGEKRAEPYARVPDIVCEYATSGRADLVALAGACKVDALEMKQAVDQYRKTGSLRRVRYEHKYREMTASEIENDPYLQGAN